MDKDKLLKDDSGNLVTAFHGTYYVFNYFYPLIHFGPEKSAKVVLGEGKWKRDQNIDINKPLVIPVNFKNINLLELLDLNDHSYSNYRAVLFENMCRDQIADYLTFLETDDYEYFKKYAEHKKEEILSRQITVPDEFDFICQPFTEKLDNQIISSEIALDNLFESGGAEQLFHQRMIHYFESIGINGFKYKNFTEAAGSESYIIFRQCDIVRTDINIPEYPKNSQGNIIKLNKIKNSFPNKNRILEKSELKEILDELYNFYNFRFYSKNRKDRKFDNM